MKTRRDFLKTTGRLAIASCGVTTLMGLIEGCSACKNISLTEDQEGKIVVKKSEFGMEKFVILKPYSAGIPADIYLAKLPDGNFTALLMLCTHKQCDLKSTGITLTCPCHGSEFSNSGKVLKDPATKDLISYKVSSDEMNIYIHLK